METYKLTELGMIALIWSIDDVRSVRPELTNDECMAVLEHCHDRYEHTIGIDWEVIRRHADELFPRSEKDL